MNKFIIKYYFDQEFNIKRIEEADDIEVVKARVKDEEGKMVEFTDTKGIYYRFDTSNVRLTAVYEYSKKTAKAISF